MSDVRAMSTLTTPTGGTDCASLVSLQLCQLEAVLAGDDHADRRGEGFGEGLGDGRGVPRRDEFGDPRGDGLSFAGPSVSAGRDGWTQRER